MRIIRNYIAPISNDEAYQAMALRVTENFLNNPKVLLNGGGSNSYSQSYKTTALTNRFPYKKRIILRLMKMGEGRGERSTSGSA